MPTRKPRNFYEPKPEGIEDNHIDDYFLKGLVHKNSFPELLYQTMVMQTAEPLNVLNSVLLQIAMYYCLINWKNADEIFFAFGLVSVGFGYFAHILIADPKHINTHQDVKSFMFLSSSIAFLTPLLQSLTQAFSNDTIVMLATVLCLIHCFAYDFQI